MVNAILAAVLSFFIPGLGQTLAGDVRKGIIFFVVAVILLAVSSFIFKHLIISIISLIYILYAAYDAYQMAQ
jgi:TM2 domain-containing membrane protein YozV